MSLPSFNNSQQLGCARLWGEQLGQCWGLPPPSVLISVAGSAQDMDLGPEIEQRIRRGIAAVARTTQADYY